MSLAGTCWACGESGPLELFLADATHRVALGAALRLPAEVAELVVPYLGLHAPLGVPGRPRRRLAAAKLARLLAELQALLTSGQVTRHGDSRAAPLAAWGAGLTAILASRDAGTLTLPLSGHGLLCEIVYRQARGANASAAADRPLHPSHRPAVLDRGGPDAPVPAPPRPAPRPPRARPAALGALVAALQLPTAPETPHD
ncbi:MAG: hypothetical protein IPN92_07135 [Chromatiaceae bacterium]|nr:hypothetical protein [Chromatiaceae bacterium]